MMMSPTWAVAILLLIGSASAMLSSPQSYTKRSLETPNYNEAPTLFFEDETVCADFFAQWKFNDGDACSAVDRCNAAKGISLFSPNNEPCTIQLDSANYPDAPQLPFLAADPVRFERLAYTVWANDVVGAENCRSQYTKIERGTAPHVCPPFHQCLTCGPSSGIHWISVALSPSAFH